MQKYAIGGGKGGAGAASAKIGEGTFSEVLKAQDIKSGKWVAIKCMKNHFDSVDHVNRLREIQALRRLSPHPHIVKLFEVLYDRSTGRLALVFELMEKNIYELIKGRKRYLADDKILHYMYQLVKSLEHMHKNGIFHRDIKPENILIAGDALKLADFGSCRGIYSKQPFTEYISTRWYRAPECLLTDGYYNFKMDMWGIGCVFFEVMSLYPLFPGENELDQIHKIHNIIGTPAPELLLKLKRHGTHMDFDFPPKAASGSRKLLPHGNPEALDLMDKLLAYNADDRYTAKQALKHPYFKEIRELDKKLRKAQQAKAVPGSGPSSGGGDGGGDNLDDTQGSQKDDENEESQNNKLPPIGAQKENSNASSSGSSMLPQVNSKAIKSSNAQQQEKSTTNSMMSSSSHSMSNNTTVSSTHGGNTTTSSSTTEANQKATVPKLVPIGKK